MARMFSFYLTTFEPWSIFDEKTPLPLKSKNYIKLKLKAPSLFKYV